MSVTITGKLNNAAHQFQAGDSIGFGLRIGVKYYDRETKQNEWTNYECAVFARNPNQIAFYQQALVEGAIVEIMGSNQKIKQFQGQQGLKLSIEIMGAQLGFVHTPDSPQQQYQQPQQAPQQYQQAPQQQAPAGAPQMTQQQYNQQADADDWEDSIPF